MTSFPVVLLLCLFFIFIFALLSKAFANVMSPCCFWPYFFVDSGGISKCLFLVFDQSWGQGRISPPPFFFLSQLFIGVLRLFQKFEVAL